MSRLWYWYIAGENELFCDLDLSAHSLGKLVKAQARLRGARSAGALDWEQFAFYQSETRFHWHLMIKTRQLLNPYERVLWESRFFDDTHRFNLNLARLITVGRSWSLLITPIERRSLWRRYDFICSCPAKHNGEIMRNCPVAMQLENCTLSADHFGHPIFLEGEDIIPGKPCFE